MIRMLRWFAIRLIRLWQTCFSSWLPPSCRYEPSCSQYMVEAIQKRGLVRGILKGTWRICRCNPWTAGGYDPVERDPEHPPLPWEFKRDYEARIATLEDAAE